MKKRTLLNLSIKSFAFCAVVLASLSAKAITVKDCPKTFDTKISGLKATKTIPELQAERDGDLEKQELVSYYLTKKLPHEHTLYGTWTLEKAANGRCQYKSRNDGNEKVEIYSRNGKDLIYFQSDLNLEGIVLRVYGKVESLVNGQINLVSPRGSLALGIPRTNYDHYGAGGPILFFGLAENIEIRTRN